MPNLQSPISNPDPPISKLQFIKLGGSLITDKSRPHTPRLDVLDRLAREISNARAQDPGLALIIGHGSGSFGHVPAKKYGTRKGVHTAQEWLGFAEVWQEATALNRLVIDALAHAGLPVLSFPPSASVIAKDGRVQAWDLTPIRSALQAHLLPVVQGDAVFDSQRGGTILSTEDLFDHLARHLQPARILLAGLEPGVWADYPTCSRLIPEITPANLEQAAPALSGSSETDVTGGMASKVQQSLSQAQAVPALEVLIFSGQQPGAVQEALLGSRAGTVVKV